MNQQRIGMGVSDSRSSGWKVLHPAHGYEGFAHGARFPSLSVVVQGCQIRAETRAALGEVFMRACPALEEIGCGDQDGAGNWLRDLSWLLTVWQRVQQASGLALFEAGRILFSTTTHARCLVPVVSSGHKRVAQLISSTLEWIESHEVPRNPEEVAEADDGRATRESW